MFSLLFTLTTQLHDLCSIVFEAIVVCFYVVLLLSLLNINNFNTKEERQAELRRIKRLWSTIVRVISSLRDVKCFQNNFMKSLIRPYRNYKAVNFSKLKVIGNKRNNLNRHLQKAHVSRNSTSMLLLIAELKTTQHKVYLALPSYETVELHKSLRDKLTGFNRESLIKLYNDMELSKDVEFYAELLRALHHVFVLNFGKSPIEVRNSLITKTGSIWYSQELDDYFHFHMN